MTEKVLQVGDPVLFYGLTYNVTSLEDRSGVSLAVVEEPPGANRDMSTKFKLRSELLSYWEERQVWVSDGRILTDAQRERFKEITGKRALPAKERDVLDLLNPLPHVSPPSQGE